MDKKGTPSSRDDSTARKKALTEERAERVENTSEFAKIKAERTSEFEIGGELAKKKGRALKRPARKRNTLKVCLMLVLLGFLALIFLTQYSPWAFIKDEQAFKLAKNGIIRISDPRNKWNKAYEKKAATASPETPGSPATPAIQEIQPRGPKPAKSASPGDSAAKAGTVQKGWEKTYPYSIYLGSFKSIERARKALSAFQQKGISAYWVNIDLGSKGEWFRVFAGHFQSRDQAEAFARKNGIGEGKSRHTRYANLIGTYDLEDDLKQVRLELLDLGFCPYVVKGDKGESHLFTGAFYQYARAEKEHHELAARGIQNQLVER